MARVFLGFGFGPIQAGLFLYEAFRTGRFDRLVVAEVLPPVVDAVRGGHGVYRLNVATRSGVEVREVSGIEIFNPAVAADRARLVETVAAATEIATALPSIDFFGRGGDASVAGVLADGFRLKLAGAHAPSCVVYTAENHNHAAEALDREVSARLGPAMAGALSRRVQFLNTVIGKMSGVITDAEHIRRSRLARIADGWDRAFLIEEFNRILVSRIVLPEFARGIDVFVEKDDLLPFEEAKLYGHNATHALIGYLAEQRGRTHMSQVSGDADLLSFAREAFLLESGTALVAKHAGLDALFTRAGYEAYVDDLLDRMMNPFLEDQVARVTRDPRRKLGWDDRLVGTMRLALSRGVEPARYARGAAAAVKRLMREESLPGDAAAALNGVWPSDVPAGEAAKVRALVAEAARSL